MKLCDPMATIVFFLCKVVLGIHYNVSVSLWVMSSVPCQNSPCFQCEDTIVVLPLWPQNSWLSVSLNTRVTVLVGWWKPSWCQCWIHSDVFTQLPSITPALFNVLTVSLCSMTLHRRGSVFSHTVFLPHNVDIHTLHLSYRQICPLPYLVL